MENVKQLTVRDVAAILQVSTGKVYAMAHANELPSFKAGHKLLFQPNDIDSFISLQKQGQSSAAQPAIRPVGQPLEPPQPQSYILGGENPVLDALSNYLQRYRVKTFRLHLSTYDSLVELYKGNVTTALTHRWESEGERPHLGFLRYLLPCVPLVVVHLSTETQGFFVAKGNPKTYTGGKT